MCTGLCARPGEIERNAEDIAQLHGMRTRQLPQMARQRGLPSRWAMRWSSGEAPTLPPHQAASYIAKHDPVHADVRRLADAMGLIRSPARQTGFRGTAGQNLRFQPAPLTTSAPLRITPRYASRSACSNSVERPSRTADIACCTTAELSPSVTKRRFGKTGAGSGPPLPPGPHRRRVALRRHRRLAVSFRAGDMFVNGTPRWGKESRQASSHRSGRMAKQ